MHTFGTKYADKTSDARLFCKNKQVNLKNKPKQVI